MPTDLSTAQTCPCGNPRPFSACCGRFVGGRALPATAEELMRSRYSAHVLLDADYLNATQRLKDNKQVSKADLLQTAHRTVWKKLEVLRAERGGPDDHEGTVEFCATYTLDNQLHVHHEVSQFRRVEGRWVYTAGRTPGPKPQAKKPGRNAPCPCGSGKKFKKCCGARR